VVQRVPGGGLHGRHGVNGARRRDRDPRDPDRDRGPPPLHRRHLLDRGAVGDLPGRKLQADRLARVPDGPDPPPLRDEGVVGDEDHGALLDRRCDPLRDRLRPLLPLLPAVPALRRGLGGIPAAPVVVAVSVMLVWGATPILTRIALEDLAPLVVATLRTIVAGALAVPLLVHLRQPFPRVATSRRLLAVSAAAGFVIFPVVYTVGQQRTSGLHGVMILAALPIFTGTYASLVARRRPRRAWLLGSAVALVGEVVLIGARGG